MKTDDLPLAPVDPLPPPRPDGRVTLTRGLVIAAMDRAAVARAAAVLALVREVRSVRSVSAPDHVERSGAFTGEVAAEVVAELRALRGEVEALRAAPPPLVSIEEADPASVSEWITVREAAPLLSMTERAIYSDIARNGPLAAAVSRVGRRLRFSRAGLDALLRQRPRRGAIGPRVSSPAKERGRW